jgi:hypothetical protein
LHHSRIECELWSFIIFFDDGDFRLFFFFLLCIGERETCLDILESSQYECESCPYPSTDMREIESVEVRDDLCWIEVTEEAIEMIKIRWIIDLRYHPIQSDKYRHLYEEWDDGPHRIDSLLLIEFEHLHTESCLIIFVFFLEGFDLWLDLLQLLLSLEHVVLRDEEDETDDDRDDDDRPSKWMTWDPSEECDEEIIDRLIDRHREKTSDHTRLLSGEKHRTVSEWRLQSDDILPCLR